MDTSHCATSRYSYFFYPVMVIFLRSNQTSPKLVLLRLLLELASVISQLRRGSINLFVCGYFM